MAKKIEALTEKTSTVAADWLFLGDSADVDGDGDFKSKKISPANCGTFKTASNITSNSNATLATDDFVFGSDSLDDDADANHDARFMFDKSKSSFYAGNVDSTQWDDASRGSYNLVGGEDNTVSGSWNLVGGDTHATVSGDDNIVGGTSQQVDGDYNLVSGGGHTISSATANYNGMIGNGHTISTAGANYNLIGGNANTCSSLYNLIGGTTNNVQGQANVVGGSTNTVNSSVNYCLVAGRNNTAGNLYQVMTGESASSLIYSGCVRSTLAAHQFTETIVSGATSGLTTLALYVGNSSSNKITIPANTVYSFTAEILGVQIGGATGSPGDTWKYQIKGVINRDGSNNTTYVSAAEEKTIVLEADSGCDVVAVANDTDETLEIKATGVANRNISWVCNLSFLELTYV